MTNAARVLDEHDLADEEVAERERARQVGVRPQLVRQLDREADRLAAGLEGALVGRLHVAGPAAGDDRVAGLGERPSHGLRPLVVLRARLGSRGAEDRDARDVGERFEALDELAHDAEDPPRVLGGEVQHRVACTVQALLLQRFSPDHHRGRAPREATAAGRGTEGRSRSLPKTTGPFPAGGGGRHADSGPGGGDPGRAARDRLLRERRRTSRTRRRRSTRRAAEAARVAGQPGPARSLQVLVYDPGDRELVRVSLPMWLVRKLDHEVDWDDDDWDAEDGDKVRHALRGRISLRDLEKSALGTLIEVEEEDGEQVLVWLR